MSNENGGIRITLEDLEQVKTADVVEMKAEAPASGAAYYGTITEASGLREPVAGAKEKGNLLLQGWCYLGIAGLLGALAGWGICEPGFADNGGGVFHWGNLLMLPVLVALIAFGCGVAESIVERSMQKALVRSAMALPLGALLGGVFYLAANIVFGIGRGICMMLGVTSFHNPIFWIARAVAWAVFGVAGGLVYGIVGQSFKKGKFGVLGGMLGAAVGGVVFDPICIALGGPSATLSRAVGFGLLGLATGVMMGLVESALKDRWLYVVSGPLAGKQFILYKPQTSLGSDQQCDVYLFKDPAIQALHATLQTSGARILLRAAAPVYVSGVPVSSRVLSDGDLVQIGRYSFRYKEKSRA